MAQTLTEIRRTLEQAGLRPQRMFGQNFLVDHNLLAKLVVLSGAGPGSAVLEVGPGTGVLTDALVEAGAVVLAVEIDRGLAALLEDRYAAVPSVHLLNADVLAGKHRINPAVIAEANRLGLSPVHLVSNLPYNIATPLICELLVGAVQADRGQASALACRDMTVTIQREVAQRLTAPPGSDAYGPAGVLAAVLGQVTGGPRLPPEAFWPRPTVASQMVRIDVRPAGMDVVPDVDVLQQVIAAAFSQRRKKLAALLRRGDLPWPAGPLAEAMDAAGIDPDLRPERIAPAAYASLAAHLARKIVGWRDLAKRPINP
ncbi:MAG: ribosomal RNA small subunit methyltransferase A [Planctomycetes bacterium]|nr:ribosomal RNA small subunit methyltransferase A [Planctomycetota bacterium]